MTKNELFRYAATVRADNYAFTLNVYKVSYDVYHFIVEGKSATLAFCKKDSEGPFEIAVFCAGYKNEDEVTQLLHAAGESSPGNFQSDTFAVALVASAIPSRLMTRTERSIARDRISPPPRVEEDED